MCKAKNVVGKQVIGLRGRPVLCGIARNVPNDCAEWTVVVEGKIKWFFLW
jgi:hypothetical protein